MDSFHGYGVLLGWLLGCPLSLRNVQSILTHIQLYNTHTHSPTDAQSDTGAAAGQSNVHISRVEKYKVLFMFKSCKGSQTALILSPQKCKITHTYKLAELCCVCGVAIAHSECCRNKDRNRNTKVGQSRAFWDGRIPPGLLQEALFSSFLPLPASCYSSSVSLFILNFIFTFLLYFNLSF